ncbi:saccharopine dehydrogenase [Vibrio breoganii]|uniref:saccharopine dehydrogenase n=1 Tax=Vibrio breoganii TaxID=553239 RepID=UPI000C85CC74|nr:saccharopine dehydrogenase [Vibrio breoganii]PMK19976.1 saccharopine dehydrogenase [Vibrio breoganii]PMO31180.1 saccharopine dehydrogenase [Vibrio breoganii]PMO53362.1 saccharopine dehydrogenase [Vibrio breoganii]
MKTLFWLRDEVKPGERRTALTPSGAKALIDAGAEISVEHSETRIFPDQAYADVGCQLVETHSWVDAPEHAYILGLKELAEESFALKHKHIYFAHAFKGQDEAVQILSRFKEGSGQVLDLEFLRDEQGRRVCAFGYWAGYVGAAIGLSGYVHHTQSSDVYPAVESYADRSEYLAVLGEQLKSAEQAPKVLVIGQFGRCGKGAMDLFTDLGLQAQGWDIEETKAGGPFTAINDYDILVNCAYLAEGTPPFLTKESLGETPRLSMISDVSCDPNNPDNPIRIYNQCTKLTKPIIDSVVDGVRVQAVDHLPTVLPKESSEDFAGQLLPHLIDLTQGKDPEGIWVRAQEFYYSAEKSVLAEA